MLKKYQILFWPDYRKANQYQELLYQVFPADLEVTHGLPWDLPNNDFYCNIFHLHWEHSIYAGARSQEEALNRVNSFIENLKNSKRQGWKFIWTIHNELPHENFFPDVYNFLKNNLQSIADKILLHSSHHRFALSQDSVIQEKIIVLPHGNYENLYPNLLLNSTIKNGGDYSRATCNILFFGQIRAYKGLDILFKAFSDEAIKNLNIKLTVAGSGPIHEYMKNYTGNKGKIFIKNEFVEEDEIPNLFSQSHFCIMPYKSRILNSGSLLLSYTLGTPAIIPEYESLKDFIGFNNGSITYKENDASSLIGAICSAYEMSNQKYELLSYNAKRKSSEYCWKKSIPIAADLLRSLG